MSDEIRAVVCNYTTSTKDVSSGSKAYIILPNNGNAAERVFILARSRGGRWIQRWEDARRLGNFRIKTVMREHGEPFDVAMPAEFINGGWGTPDEWCATMNNRADVLKCS